MRTLVCNHGLLDPQGFFGIFQTSIFPRKSQIPLGIISLSTSPIRGQGIIGTPWEFFWNLQQAEQGRLSLGLYSLQRESGNGEGGVNQ